MNFDNALHYGQLVQAAYTVPSADLTNRAGEAIKPEFDLLKRQYKIVSTIYGNDLATKINAVSGTIMVSYGFVLQDKAGNVVIAIRGTEGIMEWLYDGAFWQQPCPFLRGSGNTEDGFTDIYKSLCVDDQLTTSLRQGLTTLKFDKPIQSVTICGHSLGGALATLLALDVGANTAHLPAVYTYASPRTGDQLFASTFNSVIKESYRIANQLDIVPKLPIEHPIPPLPEYRHVNTLVSLESLDVALNIPCEHILSTYMYLLSKQPGVTITQQMKLETFCQPIPLPKLFS